MASGSLIGQSDAREQRDKFYRRKHQSKSKSPKSVPHQYYQQQCSKKTLANSTDHYILMASNDSSSRPGSRNHHVISHGNAVPGYCKFDNIVKISLDLKNGKEVRALKRKLAIELDQVMSLAKRLETKQIPLSKTINRNAATVSVNKNENNHGILGESSEKGKMAPSMNRSYKNLDVMCNEKLSTLEGNKLKSNIKRNGLGDFCRLFKSCFNLLERLMKHKYGWVFNKPVDVKGLGLLDYYTIIKHPMDLGTVKARLSKNLYMSPTEFAEDVRLTFSNAMLYNPRGQDVHIMAEELSKIFEETWKKIEAEYNFSRRLKKGVDSGLASPSLKKVPACPALVHTSTPAPSAPVRTSTPAPPAPVHTPPPAPAPVRAPPNQQLLEMRTLERAESLTMPEDLNTKVANLAHQDKTLAIKKPKVKDPDKRDMTYEEKQRLSLNLQELPSDKLDNVVQIIKKRNPVLSQQDDEIEVDIDCFDPETLWELDKFVTNYKKSLTKNKGNAEVAHNIQDRNMEPLFVEASKEAEAVQKIVSTSSPVLEEKHGQNANKSSSSSASSSDLGLS